MSWCKLIAEPLCQKLIYFKCPTPPGIPMAPSPGFSEILKRHLPHVALCIMLRSKFVTVSRRIPLKMSWSKLLHSGLHHPCWQHRDALGRSARAIMESRMMKRWDIFQQQGRMLEEKVKAQKVRPRDECIWNEQSWFLMMVEEYWEHNQGSSFWENGENK